MDNWTHSAAGRHSTTHISNTQREEADDVKNTVGCSRLFTVDRVSIEPVTFSASLRLWLQGLLLLQELIVTSFHHVDLS